MHCSEGGGQPERITSGTVIYHAHANETFQVNLGLYGALLVVDSGRYDPEHERLILLGGNISGGRKPRINGKNVPDTLRMRAGESYRLRLIHIIPDWTARIALLSGDSVLTWRALAKDGAELPPHQQTVRASEFIAGPGETMDFEYRPAAPGLLRLLECKELGSGGWRCRSGWSREACSSRSAFGVLVVGGGGDEV